MTDAPTGRPTASPLKATPEPPLIRAAGVVPWRRGADGGLEVALIHRPKYDDWSLPKGKLDSGEHVLVAAIRETQEETGYWTRLGRPLPTQRYFYADRPKEVRYWAAQPLSGGFAPTREVDELAWLPWAAARDKVTYPRDAELLDDLAARPVDTSPLILLRHAASVPRKDWSGGEDDRPLSVAGEAQTRLVCTLLAAYRPDVVLSSPARRCIDTVQPYAAAMGCPVQAEPLFDEATFTAAPETAVARVAGLLAEGVAAVVCTHRPVLPALITGIGLEPPKPRLKAGQFLVVHGAEGNVVAVERHAP